MLTKDTYKINVNTIAKTVSIAVGELSSQEAAKQFMTEYNKKISRLPAAFYTLDIDCTDMKVVTPALAGSLEAAFSLYAKSGFKKTIFHTQKSPVLKMQFDRIAKKAGLTNIEIIQGGN